MGVQGELNKLYDIDNLLTIKVTLSSWDDLRKAEPRGGNGYTGHRYDYHESPEVIISGTKFPKEPATFQNVGIIKKSYWGSKSDTKPSVKLNFGKLDKATGKAVEKLIGTKRLTLNNCKQDPGYFRQPLVYELFRQARIPSFRCNFVKLIVNDQDLGLYVNQEPFEEAYLENNFDTDKGNAYELDYGQDFNAETLAREGMPSFEGFSKHEDKKDFKLATEIMAKEGIAGVKKVVDMEAFNKFWAMEILVKHRDGYTPHQNNTFAYNDVKAKEEPTEKDLNFKFVPSGVDMTLSYHPDFWMAYTAVIPKIITQDKKALAAVKAQTKKFQETIFSPENYKNTIEPFLNRLLDQMKAAGVEFNDTIKKEVETAKESLKMAGTDKALNPKGWDGKNETTI